MVIVGDIVLVAGFCLLVKNLYEQRLDISRIKSVQIKSMILLFLNLLCRIVISSSSEDKYIH